jgi:hypothetical protein
VACRAPSPGLPTSSPMPRGPPSRAPAPFPGFSIPDGNRLCADSFTSRDLQRIQKPAFAPARQGTRGTPAAGARRAQPAPSAREDRPLQVSARLTPPRPPAAQPQPTVSATRAMLQVGACQAPAKRARSDSTRARAAASRVPQTASAQPQATSSQTASVCLGTRAPTAGRA